ncbi:MAG TPA: hypothetical protein VFI93_03580, partial [Rhizomicrobium sp.]|nr:hypothetical protein [Rhizomicrobium sp.]
MKNYAPKLRVDNPATLQTELRGGQFRLIAGGDWLLAEVSRLDSELNASDMEHAREAIIDASAITAMDSAGAWLLLRTRRALDR